MLSSGNFNILFELLCEKIPHNIIDKREQSWINLDLYPKRL